MVFAIRASKLEAASYFEPFSGRQPYDSYIVTMRLSRFSMYRVFNDIRALTAMSIVGHTILMHERSIMEPSAWRFLQRDLP